MAISVSPQAVTPRDVSVALTGSPQKLVDANSNRTHLMIQAPQGSAIAYSFTNPNCPGPGTPTAGCYVLQPGATFGPATSVPGTAVWVNGTAGDLVIATEC